MTAWIVADMIHTRYTLFGETMDADGLKTIRAVHAEDHLARISVAKGNTSQVPFCMSLAYAYTYSRSESDNVFVSSDLMNAVKKWLSMVLGLMGEQLFRPQRTGAFANECLCQSRSSIRS